MASFLQHDKEMYADRVESADYDSHQKWRLLEAYPSPWVSHGRAE